MFIPVSLFDWIFMFSHADRQTRRFTFSFRFRPSSSYSSISSMIDFDHWIFRFLGLISFTCLCSRILLLRSKSSIVQQTSRKSSGNSRRLKWLLYLKIKFLSNFSSVSKKLIFVYYWMKLKLFSPHKIFIE